MEQKNNDNISSEIVISLRRIIQSMALHSKYLYKRYGMTGPQLMILKKITELGKTSMSILAGKVSLTIATVSGIIDRLENQKLIIRERSNIDRRQMIVWATPLGEEIIQSDPPLMQTSFFDGFNCLENWEKYMILSVLERLASMMEVHNIKSKVVLSDDKPAPLD